jgi:hypothetical protein
MGIDEILGSKREEILRIAAKHGVTSIRVFGSVARGDACPDSDVDFLIEAGENVPPWFQPRPYPGDRRPTPTGAEAAHRADCPRTPLTLLPVDVLLPRLGR